MATISDDQLIKMRAEGYREGFSDSTLSVLDYLHDRYLSPELEDPSSPEGMAILELTRDLAKVLHSETFGKTRREGKE